MNERACSGLKSLAVGVLALILGGCAFGRSHSDGSAPLGPAGVSSGGAIATSGDKPGKFEGLMRGGFGSPFDVNTGPLAVEIRYAMSKAVDVTAPSGTG